MENSLRPSMKPIVKKLFSMDYIYIYCHVVSH